MTWIAMTMNSVCLSLILRCEGNFLGVLDRIF